MVIHVTCCRPSSASSDFPVILHDGCSLKRGDVAFAGSGESFLEREKERGREREREREGLRERENNV